jgi:ABC-type multidrug transport system fused ATPase/permease subunit
MRIRKWWSKVRPARIGSGANSRSGAAVVDSVRPEVRFHAAIISELRGARRLSLLLAASTVFFALGHGATALAAGLLGRALVRHGGETALTEPTRVAVYSILLLGVLATFVKTISSVFLAYYESRAASRVGQTLRARSVAALLREGAHDAPPRILATIAVRVREVESATAAGVIAGLRSVAQLVPLAGALIFVSAPLALGGALVLVPFGLLVARYRGRWRAANARSQQLVERLHGGVDDLVRNVDLWRTYGAGARVAQAIDDANTRAVAAAARVDGARAALSGANELLGALALLGATAVAVAIRAPLGDGTLVAFAAVFFLAYRPLRDLGDARAWLTRGAVAMEAIERASGQDSLGERDRDGTSDSCWAAPTSLGDAQPIPWAAEPECLYLDGMGAGRRGPRTTLTVNPGEMVTVVGPTGSGKTTLLRALLGLEVSTGQLRYGGRDLSNAAVGPDARPFAWVPQDAPLVTGSVLENVGLHAPSPEAAAQALQAIGAERLLELGDEVVGPAGRNLSGGEQRQVAIARALASGQPVLLLDEPTAGLDRESAQRVLLALGRLRRTRSVLIVTHARAVMDGSDRVVAIGASAS